MFICESCREEKFTNPRPLSGSFGPCEFCGEPRSCGDIPSGHLQPKPVVK